MATKNQSTKVRHSSESPKWGTAPEIIHIAHKVLGHITVDPFSEPEFNEHVKAQRILTGAPGLDGFKDRWLDTEEFPRADWILTGLKRPTPTIAYAGGPYPTALVNPPGDDRGENTKKAWFILERLHRDGWLLGGTIWVGFSLNQLQTLQGRDLRGDDRTGFRSPLDPDFLRCIPDHRLGYVPHSTSEATDDAPSHPSFFVLLPSQVNGDEQRATFRKYAGELGEVF